MPDEARQVNCIAKKIPQYLANSRNDVIWNWRPVAITLKINLQSD